MVKIKFGSKEFNISSGALAGIAIAGVAVLIAVAVVLWYEFDGKYIGYGSTVRFKVSPEDGSEPLYIIMQQTETVTLTDLKDEATQFRVQSGGTSGPLIWTQSGKDATSYFKLYDPKTQNYLNSGEVPQQYTYFEGNKDGGLQFNLAPIPGSKIVVGSRILPNSQCNVITPHGSDGGNNSAWQYSSQLNTGIAGIIICRPTCTDTVWTIEKL